MSVALERSLAVVAAFAYVDVYDEVDGGAGERRGGGERCRGGEPVPVCCGFFYMCRKEPGGRGAGEEGVLQHGGFRAGSSVHAL